MYNICPLKCEIKGCDDGQNTLYLTVMFLLDKKRERIRASGSAGNLTQHTHIYITTKIMS